VSFAWGAVSLDITKKPVTGGDGAGPFPADPDARQGQWFVDDRDPKEKREFVLSHEFHDNMLESGGGKSEHLAIEGIVTSINGGSWVSGDLITSFTIKATVTNDTKTWLGDWKPGDNSHKEERANGDKPYLGSLVNSWLTIEFALADVSTQPKKWDAPYTESIPEILAINEDGRAWYCYNEKTNPDNPGGFFVPAWDFGTIALGDSASRELAFDVNGKIDVSDPRYEALELSYIKRADILMNRSTDLKIGDWLDAPALDNGDTYPDTVTRAGNASLFHVPEPSTASFSMLVFLSWCLRRKRG